MIYKSILISFCIIMAAICSYQHYYYNNESYISNLVKTYNYNENSIKESLNNYYKNRCVGCVDFNDSYFVKKVEEAARNTKNN